MSVCVCVAPFKYYYYYVRTYKRINLLSDGKKRLYVGAVRWDAGWDERNKRVMSTKLSQMRPAYVGTIKYK